MITTYYTQKLWIATRLVFPTLSIADCVKSTVKKIEAIKASKVRVRLYQQDQNKYNQVLQTIWRGHPDLKKRYNA